MLTAEQIQDKRLKRKEIRALPPESPLYVLNTSDLNKRQTRTLVLFTTTVEGERRNVAIPITWLPVDITSQVPLSVLVNTRDFWDLIDKGYLTPIASDVADDILDSEDAREELAVIHKVDERNRIIDKQQSITGNKTVDQIIAEQQKTMSKGVGPKDPVNPKVFSIINDTTLTEGQKLSALRNVESELTSYDFTYILNKVSNSETRLKDWAHKR